jgi:hypothetical protein
LAAVRGQEGETVVQLLLSLQESLVGETNGETVGRGKEGGEVGAEGGLAEDGIEE